MIVTSYLTFSLCLVAITGQGDFLYKCKMSAWNVARIVTNLSFILFYPVLTDNLFYGLTSVLRLPFILPASYPFKETSFANRHRWLLLPYWIILPFPEKAKPLIRNVLIGAHQIKNLILDFIAGADSIAEIQHCRDETVWPVLLIFCQRQI